MIAVLILTFMLVYVLQFYWKVRKYPRGPFPLPIIGNLHQITPTKIHEDIAKYQKKYGDLFTLWFMNEPVTILPTFDLLKEAKVTKGDIVTDRNSDYADDIFMLEKDCGVIFSSGPKWKQQRRVTLQILRDFGVGRSIIEDTIHHQIEEFFAHVEKQNFNLESHDFRPQIQTMISNVINQVLYGFSYAYDNADELNKYVFNLNGVFLDYNSTIWTRVYKMFPLVKHIPIIGEWAHGIHARRYGFCMDFIKKRVDEVLHNYSTSDEPHCFVQAYAQLMEREPELTLNNCYNSCGDFFLAGTETTVSSVRWLLLYLAKYQDVQEKMRQEIASTVGFQRLPSLNDKSKMPYTVSVLTEIQRHSNIIPLGFQHRARSEVNIGGHDFPPDAAFYPQFYGALSDERVFQDASEFKPDRFLMDDGVTLNQALMSKSIPFGIGNRVCVGQSLAKSEMFLFTTAFVQKIGYPSVPQRYHFVPSNGEANMTRVFGIIFQPMENNLKMTTVNPDEYAK